MRNRALVALALLLSLAPIALAKGKSWKGQVPPDIAGATHVSGDHASDLASLQGRVVALHFFSTT
ncbi:hypothetical protein HY251_05725 [bacterium]|nr:hypothetical protein [bacterium]